MPYSLYFPTGSTSPTVSVPDGNIDTTFYDSGNKTGIQIPGQNAINFGTAINQNLVQMTSNFAGTVVPADIIALQGQLWFNVSSGTMYVRTGATGASGGIANWTQLALSSGTVSSFNTRTGAVTLTSGDITTALGYTPGSGTGTVTSVAASGGSTGLSFSGGPVTVAGTLTLGGVLGVANGGTGQTTQAGAANAVLPSQGGNSGKFLTTDGTNASWASGGGGVTSVSATGSRGIVVSGVPITSTGTIGISLGDIAPTSVQTSSTINATSTTTGSVIVPGGIGCAQDIWCNNLYATGNVTASASDARLKTNLTKIGEAVTKVRQLTGYTYDWDQVACNAAGFKFTQTRQVGVIAQDVMKVLPEAVAPAPANEGYLTVRYEKLVALLIEAIKEQAEEIAAIRKLLK
jgi:hypothetical protein